MCGKSNVLIFCEDKVKVLLSVFHGYVHQTEPDRARHSQTKLGPSSEAAAEQSGDAATDIVTLPCDCEVARSCWDQVTHRRCILRGAERGEWVQ